MYFVSQQDSISGVVNGFSIELKYQLFRNFVGVVLITYITTKLICKKQYLQLQQLLGPF
jgi:hypothetical protein